MLVSLDGRRDDDYDYNGLDHDLHSYLAFDLLCDCFLLLSIELLCNVMVLNCIALFGVALHSIDCECIGLHYIALICHASHRIYQLPATAE